MKGWIVTLSIFGWLLLTDVFGEESVLALHRVKRQESDDTSTRVYDLRKTLHVYVFTSVDYPAMFAIIAGMCSILAIAVLFISVGIWNMDPGKDSIIYRMTTTRMKKD